MSGKKRQVPGWNEEVQPFRDTALFWHSIWVSCGKPLNPEVHNVMKRTRNVYHFQLCKCRRAENKIKRNKLLDACINGGSDIFAEIKKLRKCKPTEANKIDGETKDIPGHFKKIYSKLYNSVDDGDELLVIREQLESEIDDCSLIDVEKVTPEKVKEATTKLKANKSDPVCEFSSDCIKNAPDILFKHLLTVIQSVLVHSHVSLFLLLSTLVPIVKDKLGNICSSKNYRSIALGSLILKIFDWIVILLFGDTLKLDDLQFAYQKNCSTFMCTWLSIETISYFLRNGSEVFCCYMDNSKVFDMVKFSTLFTKLINLNLSKIFIRLLIAMYVNQSTNVRWNGIFSDIFPISNGVKQGMILSALCYCLYCSPF